MRFSAPQTPAIGPYDDLVLQFASLYRDVLRASECADVRLSDLAGGRRYSLENLHAYLALRAHDLRPLQQDLQRLGLASLEHAEPHVLATLRAILTNLYLLGGQRPDPAVPPPSADAFGALEAGFWFTAIAMVLSGLWVALAMDETLAKLNPAEEGV